MTQDNEAFVFDIEELNALGTRKHNTYSSAQPFRHIVLEDFLPETVAEMALTEFPNPSSNIWLDWKTRDTVHQPKKLGIGHASKLIGVSPRLLNLLNSFNSYPFLNFLEKLTGIEKLLPDPYFHGGGLHQILNGGKLSIHTDFNDLKELNLYRRINVLLYLNKDWKPEYNGNLELWSKDSKECVKSISPTFNKLVIFDTNKKSYHGHPQPLNTPDNITRKSLALYYYTAQPDPNYRYDGKTDWYDISNKPVDNIYKKLLQRIKKRCFLSHKAKR